MNDPTPVKDIPEEIVETIQREKDLIVKDLSRFSDSLALNIAYFAFITLVYNSACNEEEREKAFKGFDEARKIAYKAWDDKGK